jgi:hypothetical protein
MNLKFGIGSAPPEKFILAGGKIVPADDVFAAGQQAVNEIAADKTGGAGDKNFSMIGRGV